jgi:LmbE family N-acetylglucosaminyl deacetylase
MAHPHPQLFFSPHPDDIAYSAFGSLWPAAPHEPFLITVFSQSCWTFRSPIDSALRFHVTAARREEDIRFAAFCGARLAHLGYPDSSLRCGIAGSEYARRPAEDPLFGEVRSAIAEIVRAAPGATLHAPLGTSRHVDHLMVRDAILDVAARHPIVLFEDLPYSDAWTDEEIRTHAASIGAPVALVTDITSIWPAKVHAIGLYESQLEADTIERIRHHALRVGSHRARCERNWPVEWHG